MKHLLILMSFFLLATITKADPPVSSKIKFSEKEYDFGTLPQGKPVAHEFEFTNTGTEPVVLENVKASCGCTTPTWTKEPVMPGKKGTIKAQYNMAREGSFRKSITVTTKDGETVELFISGNAVEQKQGVDNAEGNMLGGKQE
ncbi:MAG: DUF1573 domain-containing protein [Chitinophagales bacterium]